MTFLSRTAQFIFTFFALSIGNNVLAQDNEMSDYRRKNENVLKMREKDIRSDLSTFTYGGIEERIGKAALNVILPRSYNDKEIYFEGNDIKVIITKGVFDPSKYKLGYEEKHLVKINNRPFYGGYGSLPRSTIEAITVIIKNDTIAIPPASFADLYNPSFAYRDEQGTLRSLNGVYLSADGRKVYIYLLNRDASANYEVTWVIQDNKYLRRALDYDLF